MNDSALNNTFTVRLEVKTLHLALPIIGILTEKGCHVIAVAKN